MVNNPSVVLADEPTGALDSKTSVQVMNLLKEIAKDRLVIMVTYNPELAKAYATRIITLKDGRIVGDTAPYVSAGREENVVEKNMGRSSMKGLTALSLSFHNLWSKRSRTLLTAFAGSIGIIGIALIAALSSGVNAYIDKQEANMAYQYPVLVETLNMDISSMFDDLSGQLTDAGNDQVQIIGLLESLFSTMDTNDLENLKAYLDEDENDISQYGIVEYVYNIMPQIYVEYEGYAKRVSPDSMDTSLLSSTITTNVFSCMPREESLYVERCDVKAGRWPEAADECVLVLTSNGQISDYLLYVMGIRDPAAVDNYVEAFLRGEDVVTEQLEGLEFAYDEFLGIQFKVVNSSDYYTYDEAENAWRDRSNDTAFMQNLVENADNLTIVGAVQPKEEYGMGALNVGINYPFSLIETTIQKAAASQIVREQMDNDNIDIFTGIPFEERNQAVELNPSSIVNVDSQKIRDSVLIDEEKIRQYFLEGADLSSIQIEIPQVDTSDLQGQDQLLESIRIQLAADLPVLLDDIQIPEGWISDVINEILSDYMAFLEEKGYLNLTELSKLLANYFYSDAFSAVVQNWAASFDPKNTDTAYLQGKIQELSDELRISLNAYLESGSVSQIPDLENTFEEYLSTGRWKEIVSEKSSTLLDENQLTEKVDDYIENTILPLINGQIAETVQNLQSQTEKAAEAVTDQVRQFMQESIVGGISNARMHAEECIRLDMDTFTSAFSMRLNMQELSDLLLSFTNLTRVSYDKNLQELGYVDLSHPKSIMIYASDFESKDAAIAVLDCYNQEMERTGQTGGIISYTDTLGAVMDTVSQIVTIITSTLIAAVAVSLVVSSIMIGVITYISVLERRKEIGILRAMGASRFNVFQIFNAETFITGLLSGEMGVGLAYLSILPLNAFLQKATQIADIRAFLPARYAFTLIFISVVLTTIGGIMPAHNASKSDPVEALHAQ